MRMLNITVYATSYEDFKSQVDDMLRQRNCLPARVVFDCLPCRKIYNDMSGDDKIKVNTVHAIVLIEAKFL